jgi:hypothetical protein
MGDHQGFLSLLAVLAQETLRRHFSGGQEEMSDPYRTPSPTYQALDIACRRCGKHPLLYAYYPEPRPQPGPQCKQCCIEWHVLTKFSGARIGVGFFSHPTDQRWIVLMGEIRKTKVIEALGERPSITPWFEDE